MKRLVALVFAACAVGAALVSAAVALPGSIIVSQLWLYDNPDGCNEEPCGFYQVWNGRPSGPFAQMLGLGEASPTATTWRRPCRPLVSSRCWCRA